MTIARYRSARAPAPARRRSREAPDRRIPVLDSGAMSRNLVIVESPAKARTIERYLGPDYAVLASYGHVRDLPESPGKGQFGVDVEHDFAPQYVIPDERSRRHVGAIERAARTAEPIFLATEDRKSVV